MPPAVVHFYLSLDSEHLEMGTTFPTPDGASVMRTGFVESDETPSNRVLTRAALAAVEAFAREVDNGERN